MLKPTSTYKMSKATKTSLALGKCKDEHQKGARKRAMIQAELAAKLQPKVSKKDRTASAE